METITSPLHSSQLPQMFLSRPLSRTAVHTAVGLQGIGIAMSHCLSHCGTPGRCEDRAQGPGYKLSAGIHQHSSKQHCLPLPTTCSFSIDGCCTELPAISTAFLLPRILSSPDFSLTQSLGDQLFIILSPRLRLHGITSRSFHPQRRR